MILDHSPAPRQSVLAACERGDTKDTRNAAWHLPSALVCRQRRRRTTSTLVGSVGTHPGSCRRVTQLPAVHWTAEGQGALSW